MSPARQRSPDSRLVGTIARLLVRATSLSAARRAVRRALAPLRLTGPAVDAAFEQARRIPADYLPAAGRSSAVAETRAQLLNYRAAYLVNAARRLDAAVKQRPEGQSPRVALSAAVTQERRFLGQHRRAQRQRIAAARAIDLAAAAYGDRLGWYSQPHGPPTEVCQRAHGKDFLVSRPPKIGLPGMVHPNCKCRPGPPHGTRLLP